ncbi:MAG: pseudouridine synthase [Flammeovirgaceae bacterium]
MSEFNYYIIYKPFGMLPQFKDEHGRPTLGQLYPFPKDVYPVGRLDMDSEGLLLLTNDTTLNHKLLSPKFNHERTYYVQVEGAPDASIIPKFKAGFTIRINKKDFRTKPARASWIADPQLPPREPPIRFRKTVPDSWLSLILTEGKNRQVRKMTAKLGFPTLRLVRVGIEGLELGNMKPSDVIELSRASVYKKLFEK